MANRVRQKVWSRGLTALGILGILSALGAWTSPALLLGAREAAAALPVVSEEPVGPSPCGGSGDVPTPFMNTNQRVELADGELYTLVGRIRALREGALLEVDLLEHPWLASARRKSTPFYGLEGSPSFWRRYDGKKVRVLVEAKGTARVNPTTGEPEYWLSLQPVADPVVMSNRPPVRGADPR